MLDMSRDDVVHLLSWMIRTGSLVVWHEPSKVLHGIGCSVHEEMIVTMNGAAIQISILEGEHSDD